MTAKNGLLGFKCEDCSKTYDKMFDEGLSKNFKNTYQFCNRKNDMFCLILWKALYSYEHIDGWEIFNETPLPTKKEFYSKLIMDIIIDSDCKHAKKNWNDFGLQKLCQYQDLYERRDTLLLTGVFKSFRNKCLEINVLDPAHFFSASDWHDKHV